MKNSFKSIFLALFLFMFICGHNAIAQVSERIPIAKPTPNPSRVKRPTPTVKVITKTVSVKPTSLIVYADSGAEVTLELPDKKSPPIVKKIPETGYLEFKDLRPVKYTVTATLDGYETLETEINIFAQQTNTINLKLEEITYRIEIETNIESGEVRYAPVQFIGQKGQSSDDSPNIRETGPYTIAPVINGRAIIPDLRKGYYNIDVRPNDCNTYFPALAVLNVPNDTLENDSQESFSFEIDLEKNPLAATAKSETKGTALPKINFGNYYALIIGNDDYQNGIPKLKNAVNDAEAVEAVLNKKYGFQTRLLRNAKGQEIIAAINKYKRDLTENENLLIYYSGHGVKDADEAYWVPVDATDIEDNTTWVSSTTHVINNLKNTKAKHILVISDSCFAGAIDLRELTQKEAEATTERWRYLQTLVESKSRILLASGADEPVLDGGSVSGKHSVFTEALLNGLEQINDSVFTARELFSEFIEQQVSGNAKQTPELKSLRNSGHDKGYFIFVRNQ